MSFVKLISHREQRKPKLSTCLYDGEGTYFPVLQERQEVVVRRQGKY